MTQTRTPLLHRRLFLSAVATLPLVAPALGRAATDPEGPVILTLSGLIAPDAPTTFDLARLDALPQRETVTATPWHEGTPRFSGPLLSGLLDAVGATGATLHVAALNDYAVDIPVEDARTIPVILATRIDGAEIKVRDKGPLFVIYPFDEHPELFNEVYFGRSAWQVKNINITE